MEHKYKEFAMLKSADDKEAGTISGYFSTYDRIPDCYGDVIAPGAFTETIKKRKESGHPFPLCWNHNLDMIIGMVDPDDIKDTEKGPLMTASFFNTPLAQEKRELVKSGVVFQFSYAYDVLEAGPTELEEGVKAYELKKLDLFEISIVPIPANQNAVMTDIKSGRRNSKADEDKIKQAISLLQSVLEAEESDDGEDDVKANTGVEEPEQSNPEKEDLLAYFKNL
jgi:HK97 family phage prohead protease